MTPCFAYIRVSTVKQGEKGVSLQEQQSAIERHAAIHGLAIVEWFEERETAAKRGRPAFTRMLKLLQRGKARGVIIHKIDRGVRNLGDWADLGELIDSGITVHFANESLDLSTRGGRLTADIQAVVASDYIRNLREETKKGVYGRLKQGLLPMGAPLGYVNCGPGKPKVIDPVHGPLIKEAFEAYASGRYSLRSLVSYLFERGLRGRTGKKVGLNSLSLVLNNPFYMGVIQIKRTGDTFAGVHEPLIPASLFKRVQKILQGKHQTVVFKHDFLFRRLLQCGSCGNSLIGERQKGNVYYRCQARGCPPTCIREDRVEQAFLALFEKLQLTEDERVDYERAVESISGEARNKQEASLKALKLRGGQIADRLMRLTDGFCDGTIEKELYQERKQQLLFEQREVEEKVRDVSRGVETTTRLRELLELAQTALLSYLEAPLAEKRELVKTITSNRVVYEKNVVAEPIQPFLWLAQRNSFPGSCPERDTPRTDLSTTVEKILAWLRDNSTFITDV